MWNMFCSILIIVTSWLYAIDYMFTKAQEFSKVICACISLLFYGSSIPVGLYWVSTFLIICIILGMLKEAWGGK